MTDDGMTDGASLALPASGAPVRADLGFLLRWMLLGGAAGAWAGLLVGGIGGRLAMFLLRVTSADSVHGVESDDGFRIGEISGATVFLLAITTVLGLFVGIVCVVARSQLPGRVGALLIIAAGGTLGAAAIIEPHGVDFTLLSPLWLACLLFIVLPLAATALTLWLIARWHRWWWAHRTRTVVASLPWLLAIPTFVVSAPMVVIGLVAGGVALRLGFLRHVVTGRVGRAIAAAVTLVIIGLASVALVTDVAEIL